MKVINPPIATDDYGDLVFEPGPRHAEFLWAGDAKLQKSYYPGVKGAIAVPKQYDTEAEIAAFHQNDANCNTCKHLIRVAFKREQPSDLMPGKCGHHPYKPDILFHPDDWMGMKCWEPR